MAEKEVFSIDLDNKDFVSKVNEATEALTSIGESNKGLKDVVGSFIDAGKTLGIFTAAILVAKSAIEETFKAERLDQINRQFDLLTQAAGLSGETIRSEMLKASDGLISTAEATDLANKSIVRLGQSADKIPEIMELSRKIGTVTGQELSQVFTEFSDSLAAGNVRALKQYGIIVDQQKAVRDYATSIGVSVDSLTRQGQIQAIINAALDEGQKKYAAVEVGTAKATESFEHLKATLSELKDAFASIFATSAPLLASAFDFVSQRAEFLSKFLQSTFGTGPAAAQASIESLEVRLNELKESLSGLENEKPTFWDAWFGEGDKQKRIEDIKKEIVATEAELNGLNQSSKDAQDRSTASSGKPKNNEGIVDRDKELKEEQALQDKLLQIRSQSLDMQKQQATDVQQVDQITAQQKEILEQQFQLKKDELEREARQKNIDNSEQIVALEEQKNLRLQQLDNQLYEDRIRALDNYQKASESTAQGVARAFEVQSKKSAMDLQKGIALGNSAVNAFSKNSTNALLAFGAGTKTAGEAFKGFLFGAIADTAQAFGEQMLLASLFPPNPVGLAAGAGLIALAGFLRSKSQGASDLGGGFGGGGGGAASGATGPDNSTLAKQESKAVSITVQGSYFETEQTRTRLVDMIRESSDFTDFSFRQIGK